MCAFGDFRLPSVFPTLLATAVFVFLVRSQSLKTIGETCDGDCDERMGLTCTEEKVCSCMNPNATIYDKTRLLCVTKAGHPCRRIGSDNLCVPHASCTNLNLPCECETNYFQTRNGTCLPVAHFGEPCSMKKPCDKAGGMECVGSKNKQFTCQCKYPRDQFYSRDEKKCISFAGGNCSFALPCVKNAGCSQDIFELRKGETLHGKSYYYNATVGRKCECLTGFRATKNRMCLPTYLTACGSPTTSTSTTTQNINNVCNPEENLKCFDNKICLCQNPLQQLYSTQSRKCLNLVGSRCGGGNSGASVECTTDAYCNAEGLCACKDGFSSTSQRKCLKDFGQGCSSPKECNFHRGLICSNENTCNCLDDGLSYDEGRKRCLGQEGSVCGKMQLDLHVGHLELLDSWGNVSIGDGRSTNRNQSLMSFQVDCREGLICRTSELNTFKLCSI